MNEVYVKMTEEEAARRWAAREGLCLIDWKTLGALTTIAPSDMLVYHTRDNTYKLAPVYEISHETI